MQRGFLMRETAKKNNCISQKQIMHVQNECLLELLRVVFATIMFSVAVPKQITIITHKGCNQSVGPDTKAVACLAMWLPIS